MKFTAQQIAKILKGKILGNPDAEVKSLAKIEEGKKGDLCFLANQKYTPFIYTTKASVVIVNKDFKSENNITATLIVVEDAYHSFSQLLEVYNKIKNDKEGIDQQSKIEKSAELGKKVFVGAFSYIGKNVKIVNTSGIVDKEYEIGITIVDGIPVVEKGAIVPDNFVLD